MMPRGAARKNALSPRGDRSCVRRGRPGSVAATPFITSNPHGDRNPSHICDLCAMRRASQGVSPATTRLWKSVVLDPNEVGRPLIAADAKIDELMTVPGSLPGRREAGP